MKSTPIVLIILLASLAAFAQKFEDLSPKGTPLSLAIKMDSTDDQPYIYVRNHSRKNVLALAVQMKLKDATGQEFPLSVRQDYVFKLGPLKTHDERAVAPVTFEPAIKITEA